MCTNESGHEHAWTVSCDGEVHTDVCACGATGNVWPCPEAGTWQHLLTDHEEPQTHG